MPLTSGSRLGPYEIVAPLGAGGMGEVYKARDTRLDRTVAIKVLPAHVASDPQFRERFDREAHAIAALNHPHICTLYDVGHERLRPAGGAGAPNAAPALRWSTGGQRGDAAPPSASERGWGPASVEEAGIDFLVMECLEGQTLTERLERGALPLDSALTYAIEIADALDKAHRQGITHRDLKPGNIFLCSRGPSPTRARHTAFADGASRGRSADDGVSTKLLDFGLAKLAAPQPALGALSALPTQQPALTAQGTILGTFQYMAPEQLEGKDADARTDIFAFGALLYEMLTGKKAFEGKSPASLISAIMSAEPVPIAQLQPLAPPQLDHVVRRCLAKGPDARWQTARDLEEELRWVTEGGGVGAGAVRPPVRAVRRERVAWALGAVAVLAIAALAVLATLYVRRTVPEPVVTRLDVVTPPTSDAFSFALSPDGRQLAFVATGEKGSQLWLRPLDQVRAQPLAGTEGASYPFWVPDGHAVGFFADAKLKRIDFTGGALQILADAPYPRGGTWNPDGVIVFAPGTDDPLLRVAATGGTAAPVSRLATGQGSHRWPQFLPDGRRFLFLMATGQPHTHGIYVGSLDGGEPIRVMPAETAAVYAAPGYLLLVSQGVLAAYPFDAARATVANEPMPVAQAVGTDDGFHSAFSVMGPGVLAHRAGAASKRQLVWVDRTGKMVGAIGSPDENPPGNPELAPDGQRVAVARTVQGNIDVWLIEVGRGVPSRFTFDVAIENAPLWSPDGSQVVFRSGRKGVYDLFEKPASGTADEQPLLVTSQSKSPLDWSRDGRFLLYSTQDPKTASDLWALPLTGERKPFPLLQSTFDEIEGQFSPDGRWLAYASNESGRYEIYVRTFPEAGGKWLVSVAGGLQPRWRRDGHELFYVAPDTRLMAVPIRLAPDTHTLEAGAPVPFFPTRLATGGTIGAAGFLARAQYAVAADGRFLMNVAADEAVASPITIVQNWTVGLKK